MFEFLRWCFGVIYTGNASGHLKTKDCLRQDDHMSVHQLLAELQQLFDSKLWMYCFLLYDSKLNIFGLWTKKSESEIDLLPRRILHHWGVCLDVNGAFTEDSKQAVTIVNTV